MVFACKRTERFQEDYCQTDVFFNWIRTTFSRIFERKYRFDTGLKFFISFVSSPDFFKSGVTIACLNWGGTIPVEREALTINVINETRAPRHCFVREVGIGSSMQLFVSDFKMSSHISSSVTSSNWESCGPSKMAMVGGSHEHRSTYYKHLT